MTNTRNFEVLGQLSYYYQIKERMQLHSLFYLVNPGGRCGVGRGRGGGIGGIIAGRGGGNIGG